MHTDEILEILHPGVVERAPRVHALDDGCHVTKDHCVHQGWRQERRVRSQHPQSICQNSGTFCVIHNKLTAHEHNADGEDFLSICVGTHVAKTNTGETAEGEVEGGDVGAGHGGPTHGAVDVRSLQTLSQLLQPAWGARSDGGCVRVMWVSKVTNHCFYFFFVSASMDDPFSFGK